MVVVGAGRGRGGTGACVLGGEAGFVIQQLSSPGQVASVSISSQNKAKSPLTHSPRQGLIDGGGLDDGATVVVVDAEIRVVFLLIITRLGGGSSP